MNESNLQPDQATRLRRLMETIVTGDEEPRSGARPGASPNEAQVVRTETSAHRSVGGVQLLDIEDEIIAPSTPSGAVSFRPRASAYSDGLPAPRTMPHPRTRDATFATRPPVEREPQAAPGPAAAPPASNSPGAGPSPAGPTPAGPTPATASRRRVNTAPPPPAPRLARAIAVTSGKGGVGKSNIAVNLAVSLASTGRKVCLLDADLGMANVDVLCNMRPRVTLQHVVTGRCELADALMLGPGGFRLIPGASGVAGMADIGPRHRAIVLDQLGALERLTDVIIIDCAAGISSNVLAFAAAAHTTLVATTPEPPAISDAYGMIKSLWRRSPDARIKLVVNMVSDGDQAAEIHRKMDAVTRSFLRKSVGFAGAVPLDPTVPAAVYHRLPFTLFAPDGPATKAVRGIALRMVEGERENSDRGGFFTRLVSFFGASRPDSGGAGRKHKS